MQQIMEQSNHLSTSCFRQISPSSTISKSLSTTVLWKNVSQTKILVFFPRTKQPHFLQYGISLHYLCNSGFFSLTFCDLSFYRLDPKKEVFHIKHLRAENVQLLYMISTTSFYSVCMSVCTQLHVYQSVETEVPKKQLKQQHFIANSNQWTSKYILHQHRFFSF